MEDRLTFWDTEQLSEKKSFMIKFSFASSTYTYHQQLILSLQ